LSAISDPTVTNIKGGKQMQAMNWKKALLLDNPFVSTPPMPGEEIIWADMSEQKGKLENRLRSALLTSPSSLVLNYGTWGGGKTHAARYFSQETVLKALSNEVGIVPPLSIIVNIPRGAKSVIRALYLNILDAIGLWQVSQSLSRVVNALERV
jgi:Cdc6-like AAA superfamily ATPase